MTPRPFRVVERSSTGPGTVTLTLAASDAGVALGPGGELVGVAARAQPGQYWVLHSQTGAQVPAADITVTGTGEDQGMTLAQVATLRVPCGPPWAQVGDWVGVRGPFGTGWDLDAAAGRDLLVIAWESGMSLLRPVIEHAISGGHRGRVQVWAGGSTWESIGYRSEWTRWSGRAGVTVTSSQTLSMKQAVGEVDLQSGNTVALLAGPLMGVHATADALLSCGVPAARIQIAVHPMLQCGHGTCGRCLLDTPHEPLLACQDGPVLRYDQLTTRSASPG